MRAVAAAVAEISADQARLVERCPEFATALPHRDLFPVAVRGAGFSTLIELIIGQQLSYRAADALFAKLRARAGGEVTAGAILKLDDAAMRETGFSRQKMGYARRIAHDVLDGRMDFVGIDRLADGDAIEALTRLPGIGRWTAECYLIFGLGRRDVLPGGDLALRRGWALLAGLGQDPDEKALRAAAEAWSGLRTAASYLLWSFYIAGLTRTRRPQPLDSKASHGT